MELGNKPPTTDERRNVLILNDEGATAYWGNFKNVAAFKKRTPLVQPLPKSLTSILRAYVKLLAERGINKWLFPLQFTPQSTPMSGSSFGTFLGNTTQLFTPMRADGGGPKRISSSILRIMFISWYHKKGSSVFNQEAIKKVMEQLHQSDLGVHISYIKKVAKEKEGDAAAVAEARFETILDSLIREGDKAETV